MTWSKEGLIAIRDIKKNILKKKIALNILIDNYSKYDRLFRYIHLFIAIVTPIINFLAEVSPDNTSTYTTMALVLSIIVAGLIKVKEMIKYDKVKEQAKQQTVKYQQLFQRIERELRSHENSGQREEEFITWISRELSIIEIDDIDLPPSMKLQYIEICKTHGIPYDDDLDQLVELMAKADHVSEYKEPEKETRPKPVDMPTNAAANAAVNTVPDAPVDAPVNTPVNAAANAAANAVANIQEKKKQYQEQIKTLNTREDLRWVAERLNAL
jgi:hypothetical protein